MAEPVSGAAGAVIQGMLLAWTVIAMPIARAEAFVDPTRPPASIALPQDGTAQRAFSGPTLQSVMISPGRMEATISGQTVKLGEKFGEAVLDKITESEVVLRNGSDLQTLKLYPGIEKRTASGGAAGSGAASGRTKSSRTGSKPDSRRP